MTSKGCPRSCFRTEPFSLLSLIILHMLKILYLL